MIAKKKKKKKKNWRKFRDLNRDSNISGKTMTSPLSHSEQQTKFFSLLTGGIFWKWFFEWAEQTGGHWQETDNVRNWWHKIWAYSPRKNPLFSIDWKVIWIWLSKYFWFFSSPYWNSLEQF